MEVEVRVAVPVAESVVEVPSGRVTAAGGHVEGLGEDGFHVGVAGGIGVDAVGEDLRMLDEGGVVVEQDVAVLLGEGADGGVEGEDLGAEILVGDVDRWDGGEDGTHAGGGGLGGHGAEVGDGDGGREIVEDVVGAAEDDDALEALVEDVGGEACKHLGGDLADDAEVVQQQGPAVGDGIAHEGCGGVQAGGKAGGGEGYERHRGGERVDEDGGGGAHDGGWAGGEGGEQGGGERAERDGGRSAGERAIDGVAGVGGGVGVGAGGEIGNGEDGCAVDHGDGGEQAGGIGEGD